HSLEPPADEFKYFKLNLIRKFQYFNEIITNQGNPEHLNEVYTELYITEGRSGEMNNEHEMRQTEATSRRALIEDSLIKCNNIFKPISEQHKPIRTVLTKGVAGIGKSVSVQKFILDWAEGKANQNIQIIFPLPFRELNLLKDQNLSLMDLLHFCVNEPKELDLLTSHKVLFICDGLDECYFPLDFQSCVSLCDVTQSSSVNVLMTNLIKGNLLPTALIWITSRPAAADQIPSEIVDRVTEVRGFSDPQKEEYFRKRISDQILANRIITHMKSSRSLYIMCHIPVFCWIAATVLERMWMCADSGEFPKTLTQMYTHFLIIQTNTARKKYIMNQKEDNEMILKLGRLAFQQLMKGNLVFYEEDLRECDIDVTEALVYSGVCTQIFREEFKLHQRNMLASCHLTKKSCAGLSLVLGSESSCLRELDLSGNKLGDSGVKLLSAGLENPQCKLKTLWLKYCDVTDEGCATLASALTSNPSHLIKLDLSGNKLRNSGVLKLFAGLVKSQCTLEILRLCDCDVTDKGCAALTSALTSNSSHLRELNLMGNNLGDSGVKWLSAGLQKPHCKLETLWLKHCDVTHEGCAALASALKLNPSHLRKLNLTENLVGDSGIKQLSLGLENPHCKLESLWLKHCDITDKGCAALVSALGLNLSHLRMLDLSRNKLGDSGVKLLSDMLKDTRCKIKSLGLCDCDVTDEGCAALASALTSNPSHLRELNFYWNKLGDSGKKQLHALKDDPLCMLQVLR
ncbi:hypothetical protein P4O66_019046, partial [Electrophorus voltai]